MFPRQRVSRRTLLRGVAIGPAALALSGCGQKLPAVPVQRYVGQVRGTAGNPTPTPSPAPTQPVPRVQQIRWLTPIPPPSSPDLATATPGSRIAALAAGWSRMVDAWRSQNPGIDVIYVKADDVTLQDAQSRAVAAGQPGDVASVDWGGAQGQAGLLDPLQVGTLARAMPSVTFDPQTYGDQVYAYPVFISVLCLYANRARFQPIKIDPTTSLNDWSEFESAAQPLTVREHDQYGIDVYGSGTPVSGQLHFAPFLWTAGGDFFNAALTKVLWNNQAGLTALTFLARLAQNYSAPGAVRATDDVIAENWLTGRTGMLIAGPELTTEAEARKIDYVVRPIPAYIRGQSSSAISSAGAIGILAKSKQKDLAFRFAQYMATTDAQITGLDRLRLLPANTGADAAPIFKSSPAMAEFLRVFHEDDVHTLPVLDQHNADVQRIFRDFYSSALLGLMSPSAAWTQSAQQAQALLDEGKKTS